MRSSVSRLSLWLLLTPFLLWIVLLVLLPHLQMLRVSFQVRESWDTIAWGIEQYQNFFTESYYWRTFVRTGVMSLFTTFLTLIIAFPIAWYIARLARGRSKGILFLACLIPFWASELVRTYGWMILLRESGLFSSWLQALGWVDGPVEMLYNDVAVIIGLVYNGLLFMVVPLVTTSMAWMRTWWKPATTWVAATVPCCAKSLCPGPCPVSFPAASWCSCSLLAAT